MNQGWLLVSLTSLTTISGCLVIYADVLYRALFPQSYKRNPFHIANNTQFLVCSLSLSAGCLSFVALYKLLPSSIRYLKEIPALDDNRQLLKGIAFACFASGIACCSLLNVLVHLFTSESIVHCVHESPDGHQYIHEHGEGEDEGDLERGVGGCDEIHEEHAELHEVPAQLHQIHPDTDTDTDTPTDVADTPNQIHAHLHGVGSSKSTSQSSSPHQTVPESEPVVEYNVDTYTGNNLKPRISVVDFSLKALKGENMEGECFGDMDCCCEEIACKYHLHQHQNGEGLHFCYYPSTENQIFFKKDGGEIITDKAELCRRFPELEIHSPLMKDGKMVRQYHSIEETPIADAPLEYEPLLRHISHETASSHHHHHHIKTPLARLLSIGLQTTLAITMHKFPEGFIMYSTSQADARLGWTIFLSMFVHNFVEGFTMTLPIYLALNSRWKALLISGSLGAMAQPLGALLGYFVFRHNGVDIDNPFSMALIGSLMAMTSGFLTFIGMQMLTSAVAFGGKQETVLNWTISGILLIFMTNIVL